MSNSKIRFPRCRHGCYDGVIFVSVPSGCICFPKDRKQIDIGNYYSTNEKIKSTLGWTPKTSLEEGLQLTLDYYQEFLDEYI